LWVLISAKGGGGRGGGGRVICISTINLYLKLWQVVEPGCRPLEAEGVGIAPSLALNVT